MVAQKPLDGCDCCAGATLATPATIDNRPGLSAIAYRAGTWASFRESILVRLSSRDVPALAGLGARGDDDFTIALADGFAVMADVLTFYQERIANEAFLRSATERRSVLELARLLGYAPDPGVAAETWLAFALESAPGAPALAAGPVTIPAGTKVQSVPGPDEAPQTFETTAPIDARVERNAMPLQTRVPDAVAFGLTDLYLAGTGHQLAAGDVVLFVGPGRVSNASSTRWEVRLLSGVEPDDGRGLTRIRWPEPLSRVVLSGEPPDPAARVHVFRQRAALFGHNAPDPRLMSTTGTSLSTLADVSSGKWNNYDVADGEVDLDQVYPRVVPGSWLGLVSPTIPHPASSLPGFVELGKANAVSHPSLAAFGLSSKATHVDLDTSASLKDFSRRDTLVLAQSERLPIGERPVRAPVYGKALDLASIVPGLAAGAPVAISGRRQHLVVAAGAGALTLTFAGGATRALAPGDRLAMAAPPTRTVGASVEQVPPADLAAAILAGAATVFDWTLGDRDGRTGKLSAAAARFALDPATGDDPSLAEIAFLATTADAVTVDRDRTRLRLAADLAGCYDPETASIAANVAAASHGETVSEVLGSGDAARPDQRFSLRQRPLTHVAADVPSGRKSTLEVRVDGTLWTERRTLYAAGSGDRVHALKIDDDATATVVFGDGVEGARPPTGAQNIRARYRKGLGAAGNVRAGQLTTLLNRPLGVTSVTNPEPAAGGEDAETLDTARRGAPLTVLTLERAVSRRDYEAFARGFAGISRAHALWIPIGPARGVFITVAGPAGSPVAETSKTYGRLVDALRDHGDPLLPLTIRSYQEAAFRLGVKVKVAADAVSADVLAAVRVAIEAAFAFEARDFGVGVSVDEVVAVIHRVAGVVAVDVDLLRRTDDPPEPPVRRQLVAALPAISGATVSPAEILTLDPAILEIGVMP